jgi:hypothetical protein
MNRNEAIEAVHLMRTLRAKLSADMKGMTAQERLDYIRRATRGRRVTSPKARPGRTKP